MNSKKLFEQLEAIVNSTPAGYRGLVPSQLIEKLDEWEWGKYGWTSPANLIVTAAWRKALFPEIDCCRIWANDSDGKPIEGSYSIRSEDEGYTVPLFSKYDLCRDFCSSNSGMQGSRAIEKMRALQRINRQFELDQRVLFNPYLFGEIMNDIEELTDVQALEAFRTLIGIAKSKRELRVVQINALDSLIGQPNIYKAIDDIKDPEFPKCVAAACLEVLYASTYEVQGVDDHKTAADARAQKPGDISLHKDGQVAIAVEVKDASRTLDYQNIAAALEVIRNHPSVQLFLFVLASQRASCNDELYEMLEAGRKERAANIVVTSLQDLLGLALPVCTQQHFTEIVSRNLKLAPSVRAETIADWIRHAS